MANILVLQGPNLNMLGSREPGFYGNATLDSIETILTHQAENLGHILLHYQSNAESELLNQIQQVNEQNIDFIIFNPAAFTHTSIALRDGLLAMKVPFIEVHLSNVYAREDFRQRSYFSDIAVGVISGLGALGYELALKAADYYLKQNLK